MLQSMTGYGKAEGVVGTKRFTIEIRSLNSKQLDLNLRMPGIYREKEMGLRKKLTKALVRGKVDVSIFYDAEMGEKKVSVNTPLLEHYYNELKGFMDARGESGDFLNALIRIPDVLKPEREELNENEWSEVEALVDEALGKLQQYRKHEGETIRVDFEQRITTIQDVHASLEEPLAARRQRVQDKLKNAIDEVIDPDKVDANRFEQELIYYLEKLDINEERVRLDTNCKHFLDVLNGPTSNGKKLGFIAQEIGREINTMGSKANDADIQRGVVQMKDELEKIKEQVLNTL